MTVVAVLVYRVEVPRGSPGPIPSPQTVRSPARVPITGSAALLTDGVTIVYSDPDALCSRADLTAAETLGAVTLSLSELDEFGFTQCAGFPSWESPSAWPANIAGAIGPRADPYPYPDPTYPATVTLTSRLGGRRLVDAATGRTIPVFDQRGALRLTDTAAWQPVFTNSGQPAPANSDVTTEAPYFGGPGAAVLVDNLSGVDPLNHQRNGESLMIVQVAGGGWHPPAGTVTRHVMVRGHHGLAAPGIVVWSESGYTIAVIGQGPAIDLLDDAPLPFPQLMAIAGNLTGGSRG